jgi:phosphate:Na+ symporter
MLQSSSVFIAILQVLSLSGFITLNQAIPFIFGANIGTTFDSFYGILSAKKDSKKLAHFNLFFNIGTVIIFSFLIKPFMKLVNYIINLFNFNIAINIAIANILFNILGVLVVLPFIPKIKKYYEKW